MATANEWTWFHEFLGGQRLVCEPGITLQEVEEYLDSLYTSSGYDKKTLKSRPVELLDNQTRLLNIRAIMNFGKNVKTEKQMVYSHSRGSRFVYKSKELND